MRCNREKYISNHSSQGEAIASESIVYPSQSDYQKPITNIPHLASKLHTSLIAMADFGSETTAEEICDAFTSQIKNRTFLITGTSVRGLGAKCATTLAHHAPAQIIFVSRSKPKVDPVIDEIHTIDPGISVHFVTCELSDQDSVHQAAEAILDDASIPKIDVVINNAGVMAVLDYTLDKHGHELTLSSNHIGHFLLTNLIMPKILAAGKGARIVNLTSYGHRIGPFRFHDPNFDGGKAYDPWSAYGQSKTANMLFTVELARRLKDHGVQAFSVDPGLVMATGLGDHLDFAAQLPTLLAAQQRNNPGVDFDLQGQEKTLSQGSSSSLVAALHPGLETQSGSYIHDCQVTDALPYAADEENSKKLWTYSEDAVSQRFDL